MNPFEKSPSIIKQADDFYFQILNFIFDVDNDGKYKRVKTLCDQLEDININAKIEEVRYNINIDRNLIFKDLTEVLDKYKTDFKRLEEYFVKFKFENVDSQKPYHDLFIYQSIIGHFKEFEIAINKLSPQIKKPSINKPKQVITSFEWIGYAKNQEGIKCLHNKLKQKGKIDCSFNEFECLFEGKIGFKQVSWNGGAKEIVYLFNLLYFEHSLLESQGSNFPHNKLKACFEFENNSNTPKLLSQIRNDLNDYSQKDFYINLVELVLKEQFT